MAGPQAAAVETLGHESFVVRNIHCARCAGTLEEAVASMPGVVRANVDPIGWTSIDFENDAVTGQELRQAVEAGGYEIATRWG